MAAAAKKQKASTEELRREAQAALEAIDAEIAELDAKRLDLEPQAAVAKEIALAAARRDAQRRVQLLDERAAEELTERQKKSQLALIGRVEAKFAERDDAAAEVASHLAAAVTAFRKAMAANAAAATAWPFDVTDIQACLLGRSFVSAIEFEIYRIAGQPFASSNVARDFEFPGARCPSVTDPRPGSVRPLVDALRDASGYAVKRMRDAPVRSLPLVAPPAPTQVEVKENTSTPTAPATVATPEQQTRKAPQPEYVYHVQFAHGQTGEQRAEQVKLGPAELEEAALDGLGGGGPRAREIALRIATALVPEGYLFAGRPDSIRLDLDRLSQSINREDAA